MSTRSLAVTVAAAIVATLYALTVRVPRPGPQSTPPQMRDTRYVMERSLELGRVLAPEARDLRAEMDTSPSHVRDPYWWVSVHDGAGRLVAHFSWRAGTSQLAGVGALQERSRGVSPAGLDSGAAADAACFWIQALSLAGSEPWRIDTVRTRGGGHWLVRWRGLTRAGTLTVARHTGDLLLAMSRPLSGPAMAAVPRPAGSARFAGEIAGGCAAAGEQALA